MSRHYYAIVWSPYGRATDGDTGKPICQAFQFVSKKDRDEWVAECTDWIQLPREAVTRNWLRQSGYWENFERRPWQPDSIIHRCGRSWECQCY